MAIQEEALAINALNGTSLAVNHWYDVTVRNNIQRVLISPNCTEVVTLPKHPCTRCTETDTAQAKHVGGNLCKPSSHGVPNQKHFLPLCFYHLHSVDEGL